MGSKKLEKLRVQILHWNRPEECARTVELFLREVPVQSITIIDNGSAKEKLARLQELLPAGVNLLTLAKNLGWGGGHNAGLRQWLNAGEPDFCAVSAHDALLQPACLTGLIKALRTHPSYGMLCPQYNTGEVGVFSPIRGPRVSPGVQGESGSIQAMDFIHGTLMVFRRECLQQIGLFDERYFAYGDEYDLALRARKKGWKVGMVWGAIVINPGTWVARPVITYLYTRANLLLARDHGSWLAAAARAFLVLANSLLMWLRPQAAKDGLSNPSARFRAVRDFYTGRFGPPPTF